jgi:uncharacterized RDD family membrane protein YckC
MSKPWSLAYASFTRRALARLVDLAVVLAPCAGFYLLNWAAGFPVRYTSLFNWVPPESATMFMNTDFPGVLAVFVSIKLFIAFPYFALAESSRWQGTLGKHLTGIKVTTLTGERLSCGRAAGRYFLKLVSSLEFMLGYLISFSDQRQTWHDYIAQTLVLRRNISPLYYQLPRVPSRWMFDLPLFSEPEPGKASPPFKYECVFCDARSIEKPAACPSCGRPLFPPIGALRGMLLMAGVIFTLLGFVLAYLTFWIVNERLIDDRLGRDGTPWGIIFIVTTAALLCLAGGISSLCGKKWLLRVILGVAVGLGGRRLVTNRNP